MGGDVVASTRAASLPEKHVEFLMKDPLRNRYILGGLERQYPKEYLLDPERPEDGVLEMFQPRSPGIPRLGSFSLGNAEAQVRMALEDTEPGQERGWTVQTKEQADALAQVMEVTRLIDVLTFARESKEPLPSGPARLLNKGDVPAFGDWHPGTARFLSREGTVSKVFGVVEGGICVADGGTGPHYGPYWLIGNLLTREEHRRKGHAKAVVGACVKYILSIGKLPLYETYGPNVPSILTAESCGFTLASRHWEIDGKMK
jgi:GNAT superfamily N-acetyltransferase